MNQTSFVNLPQLERREGNMGVNDSRSKVLQVLSRSPLERHQTKHFDSSTMIIQPRNSSRVPSGHTLPYDGELIKFLWTRENWLHAVATVLPPLREQRAPLVRARRNSLDLNSPPRSDLCALGLQWLNPPKAHSSDGDPQPSRLECSLEGRINDAKLKLSTIITN